MKGKQKITAAILSLFILGIYLIQLEGCVFPPPPPPPPPISCSAPVNEIKQVSIILSYSEYLTTIDIEKYKRTLVTVNHLLRKLEIGYRLQLEEPTLVVRGIPTGLLQNNELELRKSSIRRENSPTPYPKGKLHVHLIKTIDKAIGASTDVDGTGLIGIASPDMYNPVILTHEFLHWLIKTKDHVVITDTEEACSFHPSYGCFNIMSEFYYTPMSIFLTCEQRHFYSNRNAEINTCSNIYYYPTDTNMQQTLRNSSCCTVLKLFDINKRREYHEKLKSDHDLPELEKINEVFKLLEENNICLYNMDALEMDKLARILIIGESISEYFHDNNNLPMIYIPDSSLNAIKTTIAGIIFMSWEFIKDEGLYENQFRKEADFLSIPGGLTSNEIYNVRRKKLPAELEKRYKAIPESLRPSIIEFIY